MNQSEKLHISQLNSTQQVITDAGVKHL